MLLIDGFDYWLSWENSLLTYKTINNDQIFQRDGRDALTMFTSHPFLMLFDKEYEILHKCLIKRVKETFLTFSDSPVAIVNAPRHSARTSSPVCLCWELGNGGEQRPKR